MTAACWWKRGTRLACPHEADHVVKLRKRGKADRELLSCHGHVINATREAMDQGFSISTERILPPALPSRREVRIQPYLRLTRGQLDKVHRARQLLGQDGQTFLEETIMMRVDKILKERGDHGTA